MLYTDLKRNPQVVSYGISLRFNPSFWILPSVRNERAVFYFLMWSPNGKALDCNSSIYRFKSGPHLLCECSQVVWQQAFNLYIGGSSPFTRSYILLRAGAAEAQLPLKQMAGGSNPLPAVIGLSPSRKGTGL